MAVNHSPDGNRVMTITGGCSFRIDDTEIAADNAVAWITSASRSPVRVYLDGNVCVAGQGPGGKFDAIYVDSNEVKVAFVGRGKLNFDERSLVDRASKLRHTTNARQYQTKAQVPNALIEPQDFRFPTAADVDVDIQFSAAAVELDMDGFREKSLNTLRPTEQRPE
jgi:hypothetical protein